MKSIKMRLVGKSPLLMHSDRGANPMDPEVVAMKKLTGLRKKTEDVHIEMARREFSLGLYHDDDMGPFMPTMNIRSAIVEGAKLSKLGQAVKRSTAILEEKSKLEYVGKRDVSSLYSDKNHVDVRSVVVGQSRVMRTRPRFNQWSCDVTLHYDEAVLSEEQIISAATSAGQLIGIGDFRPNNGGPFGRFDVEVLP